MFSQWRSHQRTIAMSSPGRQVNSRRLPPLQGPGHGPGHGRSITPGMSRSPHTQPVSRASPRMGPSPRPDRTLHYDMVVTGQPIINGGPGYRNHLNTEDTCDLSAEAVSTYLQDNPQFLDSFIDNHVSQERIGGWLAQRSGHHHKHNSTHDTARVLSPAFREKQLQESNSEWKFHTHHERSQLLEQLTSASQNERSHALYQLACCVATAAMADGFNLYLMKDGGLKLHNPNADEREDLVSKDKKNSGVHFWQVGSKSIPAALAALDRKTLRIDDITLEERFSESVPHDGEEIQSLLVNPLVDVQGTVLGVIELFREVGTHRFSSQDEELAKCIIDWGLMAVHFAELYHSMTKQRKLNEFLLTVTKSIFQDIISMDTVIMKIMNFAKKLVNADRTALFLLDSRTKELFARVFDMGEDKGGAEPADKSSQKEIRFPMDKGVAGHVASTGQVLNIPDAYADGRFNRDVDIQTGYTTRTILCMPIYIRGSIIGVVQMVNKLSGVFTQADEESFEMFAIYCGLALHHAKLYDKIRRSEQKYKVALDVLSYHSQAADGEVEKYTKEQVPEHIADLNLYDFSPWSVQGDEKPLFVIYMFRDLFNITRFNLNSLFKFTLTVRKNYRNVPYHNWEHAFSVAHAMYTVIKTTNNSFTPLESLALFVACLCHDVDHRGYTNQFMVKSASPLATIYSTSTMEHHHFNHTITILQQDGHNIFKHLTSEEYKQVLGDIKHCILATDLARFFGNRDRLKDKIEKDQFSWNDKDHRRLVQAIAMTSCDLCASSKPWDIQLQTVRVIFEEFYAQGDKEKAAGEVPPAMMDREKQHELPSLEVGFLTGICLPCYELMADVLPETTPMVTGAKANLQKWKELADKPKELEKMKH